VSLLEVNNVTKAFGSLVAVRNVSLTVELGELRAVIGPNGAGKTTFFNLISGLFAPTDGSIVFAGQDVTDLVPHRRVALGMARTFQITEIFPELSIAENVRIGVEVASGFRLRPWLRRAEDAKIRDRIAEILALTNLTGKADRIVGELSHGDQRAAEISMALTLKPRLLLLDEPTAGMGPDERWRMIERVRGLWEQKKLTLVFIEHDMDIVFQIASTIRVLCYGRVLAEGTPDEIRNNQAVIDAYLGTEEAHAA
jgi:branched-chain amino acid transport system ATP-binding protein